ncbi:MAG: CehA/McbA family metallohydrolase [bacterium]|nr:CehA/McbA family metallohydrolase [bacterium]
MIRLPFDQPGRFYKGNLHCHSTVSDGRIAPEAVCRYYREAGYDFIALTDHFMPQYGYPITDTAPFRTDTFTTLIGAELHTGRTSIGEIWHILATGIPLDFAPPAPDESGPQIARRAIDAGAFVTIAHPAWYSLPEADVIALGDVHAIEIINGISRDHSDKIDSTYMLDTMLAQGRRYWAIATDDSHFHEKHHDTGLGWVMVKSEALTPDALLTALKRGDFYSTEGPDFFEVQVTPGQGVRVRCTPADSIWVIGKGSKAAYLHGNGIREAELPMKHWNADYCRVMIRDQYGRRAWTNPLWFTP